MGCGSTAIFGGGGGRGWRIGGLLWSGCEDMFSIRGVKGSGRRCE